MDDEIIPLNGFVDTFEAFNRIGSALYEGDWHGEEEATVKKQEVDERHFPATEYFEGGIGEIRAERNDAIRRAVDILFEMRSSLVSKDLVAVGVDESASFVKLQPDVWRGKYASAAIADGKFFEFDGRITSRLLQPDAVVMVLMFDEKSLDKTISKRVSAKQSSFSEIFEEAKLWLIKHIRRSRSKRPQNKLAFRDEYREEFGPHIANTKWQTIWNAAIAETGEKAWSKKGATPK